MSVLAMRQLPSEAAEGSITAWIDVNRDGHISPVDVLIIADHMNILAAAGNGDGESLLEFETFSLSTDHSTSLPDTARGENRNQLRSSSARTTLAPLLDNSPYWQHLAHSQETGMPMRPIHEDLNSDGDEVFEQLDWLDDELEETWTRSFCAPDLPRTGYSLSTLEGAAPPSRAQASVAPGRLSISIELFKPSCNAIKDRIPVFRMIAPVTTPGFDTRRCQPRRKTSANTPWKGRRPLAICNRVTVTARVAAS
jgi:hypothetical protein